MTEEPPEDEPDAEDDPPAEEPSEDEPDAEDDPPAEEPSEDEPDAEDALESAARDEEPDIEGAKADLEAVGDREEPDQEAWNGAGESSDGAAGSTPADDTASAGDDAAAVSETSETAADAEEEPKAEDLVRDPDEPAYTSATEDSVATDAPATTDAEEALEEPAPVEEDDDGTAAGDDVAAAAGASEAPATGTPTEEDETAAGSGAEADASAGSDVPASPGDAAGATEGETDAETAADATESTAAQPGVPEDVQTYDRFTKVDGAQYERVNDFLRDRTYITAREWAIARLCSDFRTETGVEMTKIGENLPELVPFMTDTYSPQAVNQARSSFEDKVRTAGATFLYGAMCDFFTAEELDDLMYEATEVAKFLLEVEGVELSVEEELEAEDRISSVMRDVRSSSAELRHERCPECGAELSGGE